MCSLERESVQLIVHWLWLWTIGTSCCVQDSDRWCNKQHCTTTTPLVTEPLFASLFSVTCFRSKFCPSRYRISNLHVGECVYDSQSSSHRISSWSWIKKGYVTAVKLITTKACTVNFCVPVVTRKLYTELELKVSTWRFGIQVSYVVNQNNVYTG